MPRPMTITEKIIARHSGKKEIAPGDFVYADVDIALGNDITAPIAIKEFRAAGAKRVFDRRRVVLVPDHFLPAKDIASAEQAKVLREFAREHELTHYYEVGEMGVEHALLPEQGVVGPGDLVIGADSHTCTYGALGAFATGVGSTDLAAAMATGKVWLQTPESIRFVYEGDLGEWVGGKDLILFTIGRIGVDGALYRAMEFTGPTIAALGIEGRLTMANMAIEAGAKSGIVPPDDVTREYVEGRFERDPVYLASDPDAVYAETRAWNVSGLEPQVAKPPLPENSVAVSEVADVRVRTALLDYLTTSGRLPGMTPGAPLWTAHDRTGLHTGKPLSSHSFTKNLKKYARLAGLDHIHLHQTRHTFARWVAEDTGSMTETQDALGHKNAGTTRVYVQRIAVKKDKHSTAVLDRLGVV